MERYKDKFGFWKYDYQIEFDNYVINPLKDFNAKIEILDKQMNKDGYLPQPITYDYNNGCLTQTFSFNFGAEIPEYLDLKIGDIDRKIIGKKVDNSGNIASIHRWYSSHEIITRSNIKQDQFRKSEGVFIINLISFIYQTKLQFHDYFFVGRIPFKQKPIARIKENDLILILERSLYQFREWEAKNRKRIINILSIYQRGKSLEWNSDKYIHYYLALDTLWRLGEDMKFNLWHDADLKWKKEKKENNISGGMHKSRIIIMCDTFGIDRNMEAIDKIYTIRNNLFHEADFGESMMIEGVSNLNIQDTWALENLVQRIILAILNLKPKFISLEWENSRFQHNWEW